MSYADFLADKAQESSDHGFDPDDLPEFLFDFQRDLVTWALRKGRAAIFADCGLGKTPMQLAWANEVHRHTGRPVLILTPLAVSFQTEEEAHKFGIDAALSRNGSVTSGITVTNYDRLHHFDPADFGAVVCDESSALKSFDGQRRRDVTAFIRKMDYRLLCTATAAPNDYIELGTSSEALGYLGYMDMLGRFFVNDQNNSVKGMRFRGSTEGTFGRQQWRFKGHAEEPFWRWVAGWARAMRRPSDLGFEDDGFELPELIMREHRVDSTETDPDRLFDVQAIGLQEERSEQRRTLTDRCEAAAEALAGAESAVAWCQLNPEGDLLTKLLDGVQVKGSDSPDAKEEALIAFGRGEIRYLVTKPLIAGWGLNWQQCHRMSFFPSHSYEQFYQAVRRCWRFGQEDPVTVDMVLTEGSSRALANLQRKSDAADRMFDSLVAHMRNALMVERVTYDNEVEVPAWMA